ncbi:MAG: hypothetical protein WC155_04105 [Candidatus Cloacimonadales bacterium]
MKKLLLSLILIINIFCLSGWEQKNSVPEPLKVLYPFSIQLKLDSSYNLIKAEMPNRKNLLKYDEDQWRVTLSDSLKLTLMALKPGEIQVPAIQLLAFDELGTDTLYTEPFLIQVMAISDSTSLLTDIKPVRGVKQPILLESQYGWIFTLLKYLLLVGVLALIIYLIYRYRDSLLKFLNKHKLAEEEIIQLPWEYALLELKQFKSKMLLVAGREYLFSVEMSLLLRRFIARYYAIPAAEMTTYELQEAFKFINIKDKATIITYLKQLDQVKYTKGKVVQDFSPADITAWLENYLLEIKSLEESKTAEKESK